MSYLQRLGMDRRVFLTLAGATASSWGTLLLTGCRGHQFGHVIQEDDPDLVGSHSAGAAVYHPLIEEAVAKLLGRCAPSMQAASFQEGPHDKKEYLLGSRLH